MNVCPLQHLWLKLDPQFEQLEQYGASLTHRVKSLGKIVDHNLQQAYFIHMDTFNAEM